ncbi:MAG: hypothetical protein H6Q77_828 [Gemmatimonadetes bacterium]|nr:hypothetical protein [Gemmatimonadota bacterium]
MKYLSKLSRRMASMLSVPVLLSWSLAACNFTPPEALSDGLEPAPPVPSVPVAATRTCDNQPAGFTQALDTPFNVMPARQPAYSTEGYTYYDNQMSNGEIRTYADAPLSPGGVLRVNYPSHFPGGSAPARWGSRPLPSNTGSVYTCGWLRFSPRWTTNGNVTTKLFFLRGENDLNHVVVTDAGADYTHAYLFTTLQFPREVPSYNVGQVEAPANDLADGGWHKIEVLWLANTPGQRDGGYKQWVDGILTAEASNVIWFLADQVPSWTYVWFDPTYGGGANPVPRALWIEIDHFYASVR